MPTTQLAYFFEHTYLNVPEGEASEAHKVFLEVGGDALAPTTVVQTNNISLRTTRHDFLITCNNHNVINITFQPIKY